AHPEPHTLPYTTLFRSGLDSATALAVARHEGYRCHALTIAYGQRHAVELEAAQRVAAALGAVEQRVMHLDLRAFGGSALTADIRSEEHTSELQSLAYLV